VSSQLGYELWKLERPAERPGFVAYRWMIWDVSAMKPLFYATEREAKAALRRRERKS